MRRSLLGIPVTTRSAGGAFVPTEIAGCVLWLDASDTATITSSGSPAKVSQVDDKSASGFDFTQSDANRRPYTGSETINGLNVLSFNVGDFPNATHLTAGSSIFSALTAGTLFVACENDENDCGPPFTAGADDDLWHADSLNRMFEAFGSTARKQYNPSFTVTDPHLHGVVSASGDWRAYGDGTQSHSTGTNTVGWGTPILGNRGLSRVYKGQIGEVIVYDSALSDTDRQTVESYLMTKWGI